MRVATPQPAYLVTAYFTSYQLPTSRSILSPCSRDDTELIGPLVHVEVDYMYHVVEYGSRGNRPSVAERLARSLPPVALSRVGRMGG